MESNRVHFWAMHALLVGLFMLLLLTNPVSIWTWLPCAAVIAVYILLLRWESVQRLRGVWALLLVAMLLIYVYKGMAVMAYGGYWLLQVTNLYVRLVQDAGWSDDTRAFFSTSMYWVALGSLVFQLPPVGFKFFSVVVASMILNGYLRQPTSVASGEVNCNS